MSDTAGKGERLALVVATSTYDDPGIDALRSPATDAAVMAQVLAAQDGCGFVVTSQIDATDQAVRLAVSDLLADRAPADLVMVYLSCHGFLDRRGRLYFVARNSRKDRLAATAVESSWLLRELDECRAERQVVILDCCFSGGFHDAKGPSTVPLDVHLGGDGRGRIVLTASRAVEYSFEGTATAGEPEPSVFTAAFAEGLRTRAADRHARGYITVDDAFAYAAERVVAQRDDQNPQRWVFGGEGQITLVGTPPPPTPATRADAEFDAARTAYLTRLRERYGRVDLEILTPLSEQDEQPPVLLQRVFVAPHVRADPPAVELPRELVRRLVEAGQLGPDDLPDGVDPDAVERLRRSYLERPSRPVLEVLAGDDGRRLVVLGDPGAGKSTLARYLALALAGDDATGPLAPLLGRLPLIVELRTYADPQWRSGTFLDLVDHLYRTETLGLPAAMLERCLRDGRAVVVFDGLDEIFDPRLRETVTHQITAFAARYPQSRVVVTSRVIGYRRQALDAAGFNHHMLQDLDPDQIAEFAERWYAIACRGQAAEADRLRTRLIGAIRQSPAVRELAGNPMLLTILSIIGRRRELPRDRASVYQHAVTVLVQHWDPARHLRAADINADTAHLDETDKLDLLRLVARRMQHAKAGLAGNHIPGSDLVAEFDAFLRDRYALSPARSKAAAKAMLAQFRERNFILSRFGAEVYGFVHRAFLEYLAAADIVDRFDNRELTEETLLEDVFGHWRDPAWHEVLLLIAGLKDRFAGPIVSYLLNADPHWPVADTSPQHLLLAFRCVAEVRRASNLDSQGAGLTDALIEAVRFAQRRTDGFDTSFAAQLRQTVLPAVASVGPRWPDAERFRAWYKSAAQHELAGDRVYLSLRPTAAKIAAALSADDDEFRAWLFAQAREATTIGSRKAALEAIAVQWAEAPDTLALLQRCALHDPHSDVRRAAVAELGTHWASDPATQSALRRVATTDVDQLVRQAAVRHLAAVLPKDRPDTRAWLRDRAITDVSEFVRYAALNTIADGWSDDPDTLPFLRERAASDPGKRVIAAVVGALAARWHQDDATLPAVLELADHADADVRGAAIKALGERWSDLPATLPLLRDKAIHDLEWSVRLQAMRTLTTGWHGDPGTLALLQGRALEDASGFLRSSLCELLGRHWRSRPETLSFLRDRAVNDPDDDVVRAAISAVRAHWSDDPGVRRWMYARALEGSGGSLRLAAIEGVAAAGRNDPGTLPVLQSLADDDDGLVRRTAIDALVTGWRGEPGTLRTVEHHATEDPDARVRETAIRALATNWHDEPGTLHTVKHHATADPDARVRETAIQALATNWHDEPGTLHIVKHHATADPDARVRLTAAKTLAAWWRNEPDVLPLLRVTADQLNWYDDDTFVQIVAGGWRDHPETLPYLRGLVTGGDKARQLDALTMISGGWRDDPGTLRLLHGLAVDTTVDEFVRYTALTMLAGGWRGDDGTLTRIRDRLDHDPSTFVRQQAAKLLAHGGEERHSAKQGPTAGPPHRNAPAGPLTRA